MPNHPISKAKLDELGVDAVCDLIRDGKSLTEISAITSTSRARFCAWLEAEPSRSAQVMKARADTAWHWDCEAERVVRAAKGPDEIAVARELAHHYRWRASKIARQMYGDRVEQIHMGGVVLHVEDARSPPDKFLGEFIEVTLDGSEAPDDAA